MQSTTAGSTPIIAGCIIQGGGVLTTEQQYHRSRLVLLKHRSVFILVIALVHSSSRCLYPTGIKLRPRQYSVTASYRNTFYYTWTMKKAQQARSEDSQSAIMQADSVWAAMTQTYTDHITATKSCQQHTTLTRLVWLPKHQEAVTSMSRHKAKEHLN